MTRWAWWMIGGGAAGVLVCVPFGLLSGFVGQIAAPVLGVFCGLVFAFGVIALAQRGGCVFVVAVLVGSGASMVLVMESHQAMLSTFGVVEKCRVVHAEESSYRGKRNRVHYNVEYLIKCPSGTIEESIDYFHRLESDSVEVYQLPPLRPELARNMHFTPWVLGSAPLAMAALVGAGLLARRREADQLSSV